MKIHVVVPQLGESVAEAVILRWLKRPGEIVRKGEGLVEVGTDKIDTELPAPASGVLQSLLAEEGHTVPVGDAIAVLVTDEPQLEPAAAEREHGGSLAPPPRAVAAGGDAPLSPYVRRMARDHGLDLSGVAGTGAGGRITRQDIEKVLEARSGAQSERCRIEPDEVMETPSHSSIEPPVDIEPPVEPLIEPPAPAGIEPPVEPSIEPPAPSPTESAGVDMRATSGTTERWPIEPAGLERPAAVEEVERVPMSRMRRLIAEHMSLSRRTAADVTTVFEIDMTEVAARKAASAEAVWKRTGARLTYLPFVVWAVARALREFPVLNSSIVGTDILLKKNINIGIAIAIENGLLVPVLRDADTRSIEQLAMEVNDLSERARSGRLMPEDMEGGTFTITNPGSFGALMGTPIIHQPQVAILGLGAVERRPAVVDDKIVIRSLAWFSLSYDHRALDGAAADGFLARVKSLLESECPDPLPDMSA